MGQYIKQIIVPMKKSSESKLLKKILKNIYTKICFKVFRISKLWCYDLCPKSHKQFQTSLYIPLPVYDSSSSGCCVVETIPWFFFDAFCWDKKRSKRDRLHHKMRILIRVSGRRSRGVLFGDLRAFSCEDETINEVRSTWLLLTHHCSEEYYSSLQLICCV